MMHWMRKPVMPKPKPMMPKPKPMMKPMMTTTSQTTSVLDQQRDDSSIVELATDLSIVEMSRRSTGGQSQRLHQLHHWPGIDVLETMYRPVRLSTHPTDDIVSSFRSKGSACCLLLERCRICAQLST